MNKTMVKLVWSLVAIVLMIGAVQIAVVYQKTHSSDHTILNQKSR